MAKVDPSVLAALCLVLAVLVAGCPQQPSETGTTGTAVCGNDKCETGESYSTCPQDCPKPSGTGTQPSKMAAPELQIEIDKNSIPAKILEQEQVPIVVRIKNKASVSMSEEENQRITIRNIKVLFYDFGGFIGCTPSSYDFPTLGPSEEREITCMVTAPARPVSQTIRIRTYYTYDLYVNLPDVHVLSTEEYQRERSSIAVKEASVSGPLTMSISASKIPVQQGSPLNVAIKLNAKSAKGGGILEKEQGGLKYHVELLQVQIPETFTVSFTGSFTQTGDALTTEFVRMLSGEKTLSFSLVAPEISTPRETFSISAVATGFDVYSDNDVKLNVVGME